MSTTGITGFLLRFAVCLVFLGMGYYLIYGNFIKSDPSDNQPSETVSLSTLLKENHLQTTTIAQYKDTGSLSGATQARLVNELDRNGKEIQKALQTGKTVLTREQKQAIDSVLQQQTDTIKRFKAAQAVFAKPLAYEPSQDLAALDAARAAAAAQGMKTAAGNQATVASNQSLSVENQDGPTEVVSSKSKEMLTNTANCFQTLSEQISSNAQAAETTRQQCISQYPALRKQLIGNMLEISFSQTYANSHRHTVGQIIKQLDPKPEK